VELAGLPVPNHSAPGSLQRVLAMSNTALGQVGISSP
jgi:hypothetical protein